jgi:hypothetical protein
MAYHFVAEEHKMIVKVSGKFVYEGISCVQG